METIKKIGSFIVTFVCMFMFLIIVIGKLSGPIGRGLGIGILIFSILSGIAAAYYKDEDKEENK